MSDEFKEIRELIKWIEHAYALDVTVGKELLKHVAGNLIRMLSFIEEQDKRIKALEFKE